MRLAKGKLWTIILASAFIFVASVSCVAGSIAWFTFNNTAEITASTFSVTAQSAAVDDVNLIMFDYAMTTVGSQELVDYIMPERGKVNNYDFDATREQFGYMDGENWVSVEVMNRYDPVDLIISGNKLIDLNCNALYKVVLTSNLQNATLTLSAEHLTGATKDREQDIFLTSCVDFDVFYESDLDDSNPLFTDGENTNIYYPEYKAKQTQTLTPEEEANEKLYYQASYLSSLRNSHPHFYGGQSIPDSINLVSGDNVTFVNGQLTVYVNVNFAPSQLTRFQNNVYGGDINAICDYALLFVFAARS